MIEGLRALTRPCTVTVLSDSAYVVNAHLKGWIDRWKANGWKTAAKKPVENQDLWQQLLAESARHTVRWQLVKGHSGHELNDRADALAVAAREQLVALTTTATGSVPASVSERARDVRARAARAFARARCPAPPITGSPWPTAIVVGIERGERDARRAYAGERVHAEAVAAAREEERDRADSLRHDEQPPLGHPERPLLPASRLEERMRLDARERRDRAQLGRRDAGTPSRAASASTSRPWRSSSRQTPSTGPIGASASSRPGASTGSQTRQPPVTASATEARCMRSPGSAIQAMLPC